MQSRWKKRCLCLKQAMRIKYKQLACSWRYKTFQIDKICIYKSRYEYTKLLHNFHVAGSLVTSSIQLVLYKRNVSSVMLVISNALKYSQKEILLCWMQIHQSINKWITLTFFFLNESLDFMPNVCNCIDTCA